MRPRVRLVACTALFWLALASWASSQSPMLPGFPPGTFQSRAALDAAPAGGAFSLTAQGSAGSATTGTNSINYGTVSYGSGCNAVILQVFWYNTTFTDTITSATIGGNATTAVPNTLGSSAGAQSVAMRQWSTPSGSSGAVIVTFSANVTYNSNVVLYCLVSGNTTVQSSEAQSSACAIVAPIATTGLIVPTGGVAIAMASTAGGATLSFTNATSDGNYTGGGTYDTWAHTTSTGALTITATPSGSDACSLNAAAWGP